jgi:hypothetical protein
MVLFLRVASESEPASSPKEAVVRRATATRDPVVEPRVVRAGAPLLRWAAVYYGR